MFMCDPFGRSDADSVINFGNDSNIEHNYIFFFDQEPINLNIHQATFLRVQALNLDISHNISRNAQEFDPPKYFLREGRCRDVGYLITSEKNDHSNSIYRMYGWKMLYYFFHGWAALDWYRGYNRTFLIEPWSNRRITKTFIAPNRIVAGERQHRLEMLYHIFKNNMTHNHISCPAVCPAEKISILDAVEPLITKYPDIKSVFASQALPINFADETDHPMHSCWLSLFDESAESLLYLVTETVATGQRLHLTEKTFKPIALGMPFVIVGTRGSLGYLRSYGFQTFEGIWDESYDDAEDDVRIKRIASLLRSLDELPTQAKQELFEAAHKVIEHNWNHFYNGGFEAVLWKELTEMLDGIESTS